MKLLHSKARQRRPLSWHCLMVPVLLSACGAAPDSASVPGKSQVAVSPAPVTMPSVIPVAAAVKPQAVEYPVSDAPRATQPFAQWLMSLRHEALNRGISSQTLDQAFSNLVPSQRVIELDRNQADGTTSYFSYMRRRLTGAKIAEAQGALQENQEELKKAALVQGVPASVIVGIWGRETGYGANSGNFPVILALTSLAYDGRRGAMFREELFAALSILDKGYASLPQMRGSWAGAFGQPQFMPSSYLRYAVDGDANGVRDIWSSKPDVFASIGNYLKQAGWESGSGWGLAVAPPAGFDPASVKNTVEPERCKPALRKHSLVKPISEWKALGFVPNGTNGWPADAAKATLLQPDGAEGPAFLTLPNYRAILHYNCSNYYALSVLLLADAAQP
jgi:membrane-bound lytic murein transglycosylase B